MANAETVAERQEALLNAALAYMEMGFSVIPVASNKKPAIKSWMPYQKERATEKQIIKWWGNNPRANIGIVTGAISNLTVVDLDSLEAIATFNALGELPQTPAARTPRGGMHVYFKHTEGMRTASNVMTKTDTRDDGGYIIAPPSANGRGKYIWKPGRSIKELPPAAMPSNLYNAFINAFNGGLYKGDAEDSVLRCPPMSSDVRSLFSEGARDDTLFSIANYLVKGGMSEDNVLKTLFFLGQNCTPPFPEKEILAKFQSAKSRFNNREKSIAEDVREYVLSSNGLFLSSDVRSCLSVSSRQEKKNVSNELSKLVKKGTIERIGNRNGQFRRIESDCETIDFMEADTKDAGIQLPLGLNRLVKIMPGNIIVIAGEPNAGKTALLLNVIRDNMWKFDTHYFNSEMGPGELKSRLQNFEGISLKDWKFTPYERSSNFADVIKPGEGNINIIDFLEIYKDFWEVGGLLAEIHKKLKGAVAIVAIQKNKGVEFGRGGGMGLEKPRLYLTMGPGTLKITKGKNWADTHKNPNGLQIDFNLVQGCQFMPQGDWKREEPQPMQGKYKGGK